MMEPIPIYKGDNTDAFGTRTICITLKTEVGLDGATAKFSLLSFSKSFPNADVLAKKFTFSIPSDKTAGFPLGLVFGKLVLTDSSGRTMTAACNIPFRVMLANGALSGGCVQVCTAEFDVLVEMGVDYSLAYNKPTINGIEVCGDRSGRDYGLNKILDFSDKERYAVGDQVIHGFRIFVCKTEITEPGAWDADKWDELGASELAKSAVHYVEDTGKSEAEKAQARKNIGAASAADIDEAVAKVEEAVAAAITEETDRATKAEQANADAITAEVDRATKAEKANAAAITAETARAKEAESASDSAKRDKTDLKVYGHYLQIYVTRVDDYNFYENPIYAGDGNEGAVTIELPLLTGPNGKQEKPNRMTIYVQYDEKADKVTFVSGEMESWYVPDPETGSEPSYQRVDLNPDDQMVDFINGDSSSGSTFQTYFYDNAGDGTYNYEMFGVEIKATFTGAPRELTDTLAKSSELLRLYVNSAGELFADADSVEAEEEG